MEENFLMPSARRWAGKSKSESGRRIRLLPCIVCGNEFPAVRSDAKRCPDCLDKRRASWQKSERGRARKAALHRELREKVIAGYGGKCSCCGESRYEFLAVDHVNGDGHVERQSGRVNTWQIMARIVKNGFPSTHRILCHNCNCARGWYGECPHERERLAA